MDVKRFSGFILLIIGMVIVISSGQGITGNIIALEGANTLGGVLGIILIAAGFLIFISRKSKDSPLESDCGRKIEYTDRFDKSIKKHVPKPINQAIRNIGTGRGNEEDLRGDGKGYKSIKAGGTARIIFHEEGNQAVLDSYTSDHNYDKVLRGLPDRSHI